MAKAKDITHLFNIDDLVEVLLREPLIPRCIGSESALRERALREDPEENFRVTVVIGKYKGSRPGLIKVKPIDPKLLADKIYISRYLVIEQNQIKEIYQYGERTKVYP